MAKGPSFRVGVVIGVLAAAVVGLAAVVAILLASEDSEEPITTTSTVVTTTASEPEADPARPEPSSACELTKPVPATVDLLSSGLTCDEATEVHGAWQEQLARGEGLGSGGFTSVGEWTCGAMPFGERPLLFRCENEARKFVGVEPGKKTPPVRSGEPAVVPTTKTNCGSLPGGLSNNFFDIEAQGLDCDAATRVVQVWIDTECGARGPGQPCEVLHGFSCVYETEGYELGSVVCRDEAQVVRFATGA